MNKFTIFTLAAFTASSSIALAGDGDGPGGDILLGDGNSTANFSTSGQDSWIVDGIDHLYAQEFYLRRAGDDDERNINSLTLLGQALTDTNPFSDTRLDTISSLYLDGHDLEIETSYTLRGGTAGSNNSDIAEQISLTNTGTSTISFSFFQYVDFDLGGDFSDDWGQIVDGNVAQQFDDEFAASETVVTPFPTLFQMGDEGTISDLWSNGEADTLNGDSSYQGDVAWAFQWDITLEAGESFLISKDKSIVPTPGSMALLTTAGLLCTRRRRA